MGGEPSCHFSVPVCFPSIHLAFGHRRSPPKKKKPPPSASPPPFFYPGRPLSLKQGVPVPSGFSPFTSQVFAEKLTALSTSREYIFCARPCTSSHRSRFPFPSVFNISLSAQRASMRDFFLAKRPHVFCPFYRRFEPCRYVERHCRHDVPPEFTPHNICRSAFLFVPSHSHPILFPTIRVKAKGAALSPRHPRTFCGVLLPSIPFFPFSLEAFPSISQ